MKKVLSIRSIIVLVFVICMVVSVTVVSTIVFINWGHSARRSTKSQAHDLHHSICNKIDHLLDVSMRTIEVNSYHLENEIITIHDEKESYHFFVNVIKSLDDSVYSFSFGTVDGEYYGARRNKDKEIEIMRNNEKTNGESWYYSINKDMTIGDISEKYGKFDARTRDWYKKALNTDSIVFSDVYYHFVRPDYALSVSKLIKNKEGKVLGVLGIHLVLSDLDAYLEEVVKEKKGYAFIVEKESNFLIANSLGIDNFVEIDGERVRQNLLDLNNEVINGAFKEFKTTNNSQFKYKSIYFNFILNDSGLGWIIGTAIPESYLMKDVWNNILITVMLVIAFIISSIVIYYSITNKMVKPVDNLIDVADKFTTGNLSLRVKVVRDDEIGQISRSFNSMADTIHALVNDLEEKVRERTSALEDVNVQLRDKEEQLRIILDSAAECIFGVDVNGICTFCNKSCIKVLGYNSVDEILGKDMHSLIHGYKDGVKVKRSECMVIKSIIDGIGYYSDEETFVKKDNTQINVSYYSYPQYKGDEIIGAVVTFVDITKKKEEERRIRYLSNHDPLTGFANKRHFEDLLDTFDTKENLPISVIYADLNALKLTNDVFGHEAGDELIVKSAECIKRNVKEGGFIARMGGDEFVILLPDTDEEGALEVIKNIEEDVSNEYVRAVKCSIALGYDIKTSRFQDIKIIMNNAEGEMYKNKSRMRRRRSKDTINSFMRLLHERSERERIHSERVSILCEKMAKALNLPEPEVKKLKNIGYLHDIGKIGIDSSLLNKESLNEDEMQAMQQHAFIGYRILNLFESTIDYADSVFSHHERWDGTGYPKGVKGNEIPMNSRIISIAEVYERMITKKPMDEILDEIKYESGKSFDPDLVPVFLEVVKNIEF